MKHIYDNDDDTITQNGNYSSNCTQQDCFVPMPAAVAETPRQINNGRRSLSIFNTGTRQTTH